MVVDSLLELVSHNASNISSSDLVPGLTLLASLFPGYAPIHKYLLLTFGFDVTILVSLGVVLWFGTKLFRSVWAVVGNLVYNYCMSAITIDRQDEIYDHVMSFLEHETTFKSSRRLTAETISKSTWELEAKGSKAGEAKTKWLNFANPEGKSQLRFTPAVGSHNFWYRNKYFRLRRTEVTVFDGVTWKDQEQLTLSCLWLSVEPIKQLIEDAKNHTYRRQKITTMVKRPGPKELRKFGGRGCWVKVAERPCRPIETVVLDTRKKNAIAEDINEYLNPATAHWYANRGIPYRRGYLLYGPPGTGKTSLTFALAGVFGLDIHVVSLQEPSITEEDLGLLFTHLPARCIVLLEDIDTAGLIREPIENNDKIAPAVGEFNVVDLAKVLKKANQLSEEEKKKGITLSGLLNVIDGVASHEGHVLVMTTNHPEKLDAALTRPGRVDLQVEFKNTTREETKRMFERMYTKDVPKDAANPTNSPPNPEAALNNIIEHGEEEKPKELSINELILIAEEFASKVPESEFSPAEIQGFLLMRKNNPRKALSEVAAWVEGMKEAKGTGSKILQVQ